MRSMTERRIVISGYYGFGNTGDEAVLSGILRSLAEVGVTARVTVLSVDPKRTMAEHRGVRAVHRYCPISAPGAIRSADLVISGGGSLLQDATSAHSIHYYLGIIRLARFFRKPVAVYAQGIGPLIRPWSRRAVARALEGVDLLTVRDTDSKQLLESIGVRMPIAVVADPSFVMEADLAAADALIDHVGLAGREFVAASLRPWPGAQREIDECATGICRACDERGLPVLSIAMQPEEDGGVSRLPGAMTLDGSLGPDVIKGVLARAKLVVGMRLHALIFAAAEGVPFVPVVYDPKVESFAQWAGQPAGVGVDRATSEAMREAVLGAWDDRERLAEIARTRASEGRESALEAARLTAGLIT